MNGNIFLSLILTSVFFLTSPAYLFAESAPIAVFPFRVQTKWTPPGTSDSVPAISIKHRKDSYQTDSSDPMGEQLATSIISQLQTKRDFTIVERSRLNKIIEEMELQQSALVAGGGINIQRLSGVRFGIMGEVTGDNKNMTASGRVVNLERGTIIAAKSANGNTDEVADKLASELGEALAVYLSLENPASPYSILLKMSRVDDNTKPISDNSLQAVDKRKVTKQDNIQKFKSGETVMLTFKVLRHNSISPSKVYLQIYSINSAGVMSLIYPNRYTSQKMIEIDREYTLPSNDDAFEWEVSGPAGIESIQAVVTDAPVELFQVKHRSEVFPEVSVAGNQVATYRTIKTKLKKEKLKEWSAERIIYEVTD